MNVQLSSRSDEWNTPKYLIDMVCDVIGPIELDPASDATANCTVQAEKIITKEQDGLVTPWGNPKTIFLNPPGGKIGNRSKAQLFWDRLLDSTFEQAIFMGFSLEQLQTTQRSRQSILDFPFCVPSKRIRFISPNGKFNAPSHSNVIAYIGHFPIKFYDVFSKIGKVKL